MSGTVIDLQQAREARIPEPWVGKKELARHMGVSPRTVERWLSDPRYTIKG